jgi:hypothetical protein
MTAAAKKLGDEERKNALRLGELDVKKKREEEASLKSTWEENERSYKQGPTYSEMGFDNITTKSEVEASETEYRQAVEKRIAAEEALAAMKDSGKSKKSTAEQQIKDDADQASAYKEFLETKKHFVDKLRQLNIDEQEALVGKDGKAEIKAIPRALCGPSLRTKGAAGSGCIRSPWRNLSR